MRSLNQRSNEPELMDNVELSKDKLEAVFSDINRINGVLKGIQLTKTKLWSTIKENIEKRYLIYDFGCGDGELLRKLSEFLRAKRIKFNMVGLDISEKAIAIAEEKSQQYSEISYSRINILEDSDDIEPCDILLCSLTMHHFDDKDIPELLKRFTDLTKQEIIINDLKRSPWACFWFKIISTLLLKTKIAKNDGLISIKSGFTKSEINHFSKGLNEVDHQIAWFPNFRFVWSMQRRFIGTAKG